MDPLDRDAGQKRYTIVFFHPVSKIVAGRSVSAFAGGHVVHVVMR
jgi:hypothetical protein